MPRGDLGEFFLQTAGQLGRQQALAEESMYRKAQTGAILQKMQDERDIENTMATISQSGQEMSQYDMMQKGAEALLKQGKVRAGMLLGKEASAEKDKQIKGLSENLKSFQDDPDMFNKILQSDAYKEYRKQYGIHDGAVINLKDQEQYYTHDASPDKPLITPKGIITEGKWDVKEKRGQVSQWLRKDRDEEATADLRNFEIVEGIDSSLRGTPQYKTAYMKYKKEVGETRPTNFSVIQTGEGFQAVNPRNPTAAPVPIKGAGGEQVRPPLEAAARDKFADLFNLQDMTKEVKDKYKEGFVGPWSGRWGQWSQYVIDKPKEQIDFYAIVKDMSDVLLRARSGAQINEQEYKRLNSFLPDPNLPAKNFVARLDRWERQLENTLRNKTIATQASGKTVPQKTRPPLDSFER